MVPRKLSWAVTFFGLIHAHSIYIYIRTATPVVPTLGTVRLIYCIHWGVLCWGKHRLCWAKPKNCPAMNREASVKRPWSVAEAVREAWRPLRHGLPRSRVGALRVALGHGPGLAGGWLMTFWATFIEYYCATFAAWSRKPREIMALSRTCYHTSKYYIVMSIERPYWNFLMSIVVITVVT